MSFYECTVAVVGGVGLPNEGEGVTSPVGVTKWVGLLCVLRKMSWNSSWEDLGGKRTTGKLNSQSKRYTGHCRSPRLPAACYVEDRAL